MSDPDPAPDEVPDATTTTDPTPADPPPAEPAATDPAPTDPPATGPADAPAGAAVDPALEVQAYVPEGPPPVPVCSACGHAVAGHVDGSGFCLIQLGDYGGDGPCGCVAVAA